MATESAPTTEAQKNTPPAEGVPCWIEIPAVDVEACKVFTYPMILQHKYANLELLSEILHLTLSFLGIYAGHGRVRRREYGNVPLCEAIWYDSISPFSPLRRTKFV